MCERNRRCENSLSSNDCQWLSVWNAICSVRWTKWIDCMCVCVSLCVSNDTAEKTWGLLMSACCLYFPAWMRFFQLCCSDDGRSVCIDILLHLHLFHVPVDAVLSLCHSLFHPLCFYLRFPLIHLLHLTLIPALFLIQSILTNKRWAQKTVDIEMLYIISVNEREPKLQGK